MIDQPNLHHIFPRDFCTRHLAENERCYADSLLNIAYLTQLTNLKISNNNPVEYMQDYLAEFPKYGDSHLLPENLKTWALQGDLPSNALTAFIEARLDRVLQILDSLVLRSTLEVIDLDREATS